MDLWLTDTWHVCPQWKKLIVSIIEDIQLIGVPPCASGIIDAKDSAVLFLCWEAAFASAQAVCPGVYMAVQFQKSSL